MVTGFIGFVQTKQEDQLEQLKQDGSACAMIKWRHNKLANTQEFRLSTFSKLQTLWLQEVTEKQQQKNAGCG